MAAFAALSDHLFSRISADVSFLSSQSLLDAEAADAILRQLDDAAARLRTGGIGQTPGQGFVTSVAQGRVPPPLPPQSGVKQSNSSNGRERAEALWTYSGSQSDDLSFQKGDVVIIHSKENDHWWRGSVMNDPSERQGLFPSNHVKILASGIAPSKHQISGLGQSTSYYGSPDPEKAAMDMQPYQMHAPPPPSPYYNQGPPPPPQQQFYQQQPQQMAISPGDPARRHKFKLPNGMGSTLAHSFVGGAGFGAGSAAAGDLIHAIF
ncbi:MAG: hypothetical protein CYPHOPRED_005860 [Cyphobasidiales sp. Tagirdzhanova-0007]|nr:MAG: hypothetical protein CYPHOPRED_005860 [Cyphobasidiales sp. Tagirdzhanova-0007]